MICPASMRPHADRVLRGEYALPAGYELSGVRRVLDVGANVGAFALWAHGQWPEAQVICYEPHPDNVKLLRENAPFAEVYELAVSDEGGIDMLYSGKNNCGEGSLYDLGEQDVSRCIDVRVVRAATLGECDVLKIDAEGEELPILRNYAGRPGAVMLEWHRPYDRWAIGELLSHRGYECVRDEVRRKDRGIMIWVEA